MTDLLSFPKLECTFTYPNQYNSFNSSTWLTETKAVTITIQYCGVRHMPAIEDPIEFELFKKSIFSSPMRWLSLLHAPPILVC
ncbi:MAG: hypothetical protein CM1200mP41_31590 [Gammaproteobacteria bacterium]|nr:MAG: hypothetical protein CM1200mP41_31590 [Gammaproteobacteria bacterium]